DAGEQAQRWLQIVEAALLQARSERTAAYLFGAAARAAGVLGLAALLTWLLSRVRRRLPLRLAHWRALPMHSPLGGQPGWQLAIGLVCVALQALVWIAAVAYGGAQFPATRRLRL